MNKDDFADWATSVVASIVGLAFAWMLVCGGIAVLRESEHSARRVEQLEAREGE